MSNKWKDNPCLWEEIYESNTTHRVAKLFSKFDKVSVEPKETPEVLKGLKPIVDEFWEKAKSQNPNLTSDPKYGLRGLEDVELIDRVLTIRPFVTDYALVRFKNSRSSNEGLTSEQVDFLDNHFLTLGVHGYLLGNCYSPALDEEFPVLYLAERVDKGPRAGLIETIPQGLVDPEKDGYAGDIFRKALARELKEETSLELEENIEENGLTHINIGSKYGDFTLVSRLKKRSGAVRLNPNEHKDDIAKSFYSFYSDSVLDYIRNLGRNSFNPVTIKLLEELPIW